MLRVENIHKQFAGHNVLNGVNLTLPESAIIGLAGTSGSGKSTLLRCLQGLEAVDSGGIHFSGKKGFMFQDFQLFPHMTVLQNLTYAPRIYHKNIEQTQAALDLLSSLGIEEKAHAYPAQLSGGQKQRVALARSLMMRPKLLLCDEPTSGLDIASIEEVVRLLKTVQSWGVMIIVASHDLNFLSRVADRVVLLKHGQIVADIAPDKVENPTEVLSQYY